MERIRSMDKMNNFNEAKAVEYTNYKDAKGFERCLTFRGDSGTEVIEKMDKAIEAIIEKGGTPIAKNFSKFNKPEVPTKPCPKHNVPMKEKISKKDGSKYYSHSRGVYPNLEWCNGTGFPGDLRDQVDEAFERAQNEEY